MKKSLLFIFIISMLCCLTACDTGEGIGTYDYYAKIVHKVNKGSVEPINNKDSVALCQMLELHRFNFGVFRVKKRQMIFNGREEIRTTGVYCCSSIDM